MGCKTYSTKEIQKILRKNGYEFVRQNGDHLIYSNGTNKITINININKMVARRIIKENGLNVKSVKVRRVGDRTDLSV